MGRKQVKRNIELCEIGRSLWLKLKEFRFTVKKSDNGYTIRLVTLGISPLRYSKWEEVAVLEAVAIGVHYYPADDGDKSVTILMVRDLYDQWEAPLFDGFREFVSTLYPVLSTDSPAPVELPSRDIQENQFYPMSLSPFNTPNIPNWDVPFVRVDDIVEKLHVDGHAPVLTLKKDALPRMFYVRAYGTDLELNMMATKCEEAGVLCKSRIFTQRAHNDLSGPFGTNSALGRYAIATNMILGKHVVLPQHLPYIVQGTTTENRWDNID